MEHGKPLDMIKPITLSLEDEKGFHDTFMSVGLDPTQIKGAVAAEGTSKVEVSGRFRLHGKEHEVTFPVEVVAEGQKLQVAIHFVIPYVEWGLKNPSNFFLHASDKVEVEIHATGHLENATASN